MSSAAFTFRLYVAGAAPNSLLAIANLTQLCETHLPDRYEIEIVDVLLEPKRALTEAFGFASMRRLSLRDSDPVR